MGASQSSPESRQISASSKSETESPIRVFSHPTVLGGAQLVLGRNHSSGFLCFAKPYGIALRREDRCLNFLDPHNPQTYPEPSSERHPRFLLNISTYGNTHLLQEEFAQLKDAQGRLAVKDTGLRVGSAPVIEVLVPENELAYACAHCGKWETTNAPRFIRCPECRSRRYCSQQCLEKDWKTELHRGDCSFLKDGKEFYAEHRRLLHDNNWNLRPNASFRSKRTSVYDDPFGPENIDMIVHGAQNPPRSVSHSTRGMFSHSPFGSRGGLGTGAGDPFGDFELDPLAAEERLLFLMMKNSTMGMSGRCDHFDDDDSDWGSNGDEELVCSDTD